MKKISKKFKKIKKVLAMRGIIVYTNNCCDMIAMKREVATVWWVFPWSECQEVGDQLFLPAGNPDGKSLYKDIVSANEQINVCVAPL